MSPTIQNRLDLGGIVTPVLVLALCCILANSCRSAPRVADSFPERTAPPGPTLQYHLHWNGAGLDVRASLPGDADGKTRLLLPHSWAGADDLGAGITDLAIASPGVEVDWSAEAKGVVVVRHIPGARLRVHYRVRQIFRDDLVTNRFRPMFGPEFMHAIGYGVFIQPDRPPDEVVDVALHWHDFPRDWALANSWGVDQPVQTVQIELRDLRHSLYLGGDFRLTAREIRGKPVWVAIRGEWPFDESRFVEVVDRVVDEQRSFWNDHDFPHFLISLMPVGETCCVFAGAGLANSFTTYVAADSWRHEDLVFLLAHELFHTWNGGKISAAPGQGRGMFWFSEGFTSYYTRVLALRAGLLDLPQYVRGYNEDVASYMLSPVRNAPNERITAEFWSDPDIHQLPYFRGTLIAHRWNAEIRRRADGRRSLDDAMRELLRHAEQRDVRVNAAVVSDAVGPMIGRDVTSEIAHHIDAGATLEPGSDDLGPCVSLTWRDIGFFELGFDFAATKASGEVAGVVAGSAAHEAGLRDGQSVVGWDVRISKPFPTQRAAVTILHGRHERTIEWFPVGQQQAVPQYVVDEERLAHRPAECLRWFGVDAAKSAAQPEARRAVSPPGEMH